MSTTLNSALAADARFAVSTVDVIQDYLASAFQRAISTLVESGLPAALNAVEFEIAEPRQKEHGDFACNIALVGSKAAGLKPRDLAERVREQIIHDPAIESVELAGPGFINVRLRPKFVAGFVPTILAAEDTFHLIQAGLPKRINLEFVSVNPNGPITVGSGRGAAFGDTLCRVLRAVGNEVHAEFYINDGVSSEQMRLFAASVRHYVLAETGLPSEFPEGGYKGLYVQEIARWLHDEHGPHIVNKDVAWYHEHAQNAMIHRQRLDLARFGVRFDTWFSEQSLHDSGQVGQRLQELQASGIADEKPYQNVVTFERGGKVESVEQIQQAVDEDDVEGAQPTLWLRSTKFGDDRDRVLRRRDGRPTYIASDVAYHADKFNRPVGTHQLITVLGPDHHGYIARLLSVVAALEAVKPLDLAEQTEPRPLSEWESAIYADPAERERCAAALESAKRKLKVVIFQIVRFVKDGQPAPMRKRDGNIFELRDLMDDIGEDVARFFYLMRSHDTHMDFDIDLATKQSDDNPVFYVQYAHARICSLLLKAEIGGFLPHTADGGWTALLQDPRELALVKKILELREELKRCSEDFGVHRLTTYAIELARTYHHFYDACRVIQPDQPDLTRARLSLCVAARIGLRSVFNLLGISAPERMDREAQAE